MVTGAGGSIGSELCRQIAEQSPKQLILYEISEFALYSIQVELMRIAPDVDIKPILGSVTNENRLNAVFRKFKVQTIYHAAAYKHVPMVEYNIGEGVRNNFIGTAILAKAAMDKVETFVLVSTDKAVRPTNIMGGSKRLAEMYLQQLATESIHTVFSMVRFGNVLGSSGSVVPLFLEYLARNEPLPVTDPEITRYFMSIPEAAQLVIQAGAMAEGGEVFVLDMGKPVRIIDLAKNLLFHYGFSSDNIVFTGLRPGEKLYEELLIGENVSPTSHPRICKAQEKNDAGTAIKSLVQYLDWACDDMDYFYIIKTMKSYVSGFNHSDELKDHLV